MQKQEKRLRAVQKRLADRAGAASPVTDVTTEAETETEESSVEDEPLSETVSELQTALRQARAEARKWKSAYEQYHRITHGN